MNQIFLSLCIVYSLTSISMAQPVVYGALTIHPLWGIISERDIKNVDGFVEIENKGVEWDELTAAEFEGATRIDLHQTLRAGDVVVDREVDRIPIPSGRVVFLNSTSFHLMVRLEKPVKPGDLIVGALYFSKAGRVPVEMLLEDGDLLPTR